MENFTDKFQTFAFHQGLYKNEYREGINMETHEVHSVSYLNFEH